jgi:hypothetical protein
MQDVMKRYERYEATGNRKLVLVTNEADEAAAALFDLAILPALNHYGMPYTVADVSKGRFDRLLGECAAVVLAHDGVAAALTGEQWADIAEASERGAGAVCFDGALASARPEIRAFFGSSEFEETAVDGITVNESSHYITELQAAPVTHALRKQVSASLAVRQSMEPGFVPIAEAGGGRVAAAAFLPAEGRDGKGAGRRAALYFSPALWMKQHFGHAMGLDDLLWRSLVWTAKKPFASLMMPPFAVCRVDDAIGSYDSFDYVRVLNEYGWIPNIGVFVNEIGEAEGAAMKHYYDRHKAEFSAHSFHELEEGTPDQIYLRHDGTEYGISELQEHFRRLDAFYDKLGITPSRTVNIHYDELGLNSLPFLLKRDQPFMMALIPFGVHWYANSYSWEPYPYGHQGFNYGPMDPDHRFWNAVGHHLGAYKTPDAGMGPGEFLGSCTVFNGENERNDLAAAIARGVTAVKLGVSSGFFGTLMTHEQRIAVLNPEEWRTIIEGIHDGLAGWTLFYRGYDEIAAYCKDKARTRIAGTRFDERNGKLAVELEGISENGLYVCVYRDEAESASCEFVRTAPFAGRLTSETL